jgi:hypothetical protein
MGNCCSICSKCSKLAGVESRPSPTHGQAVAAQKGRIRLSTWWHWFARAKSGASLRGQFRLRNGTVVRLVVKGAKKATVYEISGYAAAGRLFRKNWHSGANGAVLSPLRSAISASGSLPRRPHGDRGASVVAAGRGKHGRVGDRSNPCDWAAQSKHHPPPRSAMIIWIIRRQHPPLLRLQQKFDFLGFGFRFFSERHTLFGEIITDRGHSAPPSCPATSNGRPRDWLQRT